MEALPVVLLVMAGYLAIGAASSLWLLLFGVRRIDANPLSWGARIVLFPGCCAVWPVLIVKAVRA